MKDWRFIEIEKERNEGLEIYRNGEIKKLRFIERGIEKEE